MILTFHDYILAKRPWAYCHLDEVIENVVYLDQTSKQNHLYPKVDEQDEFIQAATNQITVPIVEKGISIIESPQLSEFSFNWDEPEMNLSFRIPQFLSETIIYRNREKIQNPIMINHLWIDFLLNDFNPTFYFDKFKDLFNTLNVSTGSEMWFSEEPFNFTHFLGYGGQNGALEIQHERLHEFFELQWVMGPIRAYTVTQCFFDDADFPIRQKLFLNLYIKSSNTCFKSYEISNRTWTGSAYLITHPVSFQGLHRFTLGIKQLTLGSITISLSLDGGNIEEFIVTSNLSMLDYDNYKDIGFIGANTISNVSVFINTQYPNQEWLTASQLTLSVYARYECTENHWTRFNLEDDSLYRISRSPSSFMQFFDCIALYGCRQNIITTCSNQSSPLKLTIDLANIDPVIGSGELVVGQTIKINGNLQLPFYGVWRVTGITKNSVIITPSLTCEIEFSITTSVGEHVASSVKMTAGSQMSVTLRNSNLFRVDDYVVLSSQYTTEQPYGALSQKWVIESLNANQTVIRLDERYQGSYSDEVIIKKIPFGGIGAWKKTWLDDKILYTPRFNSNNPKHLLIDDSNSIFTTVQLSDQDGSNPSDESFIFKKFKSKGTAMTSAIGDKFRCFVFIAAKNESVSHSQPFVYGEVRPFITPNDWVTYLVAFESSSVEKLCNYNLAFQYPHWSILLSGSLLCQNVSNSRSSQTDSHYLGQGFSNVSDADYYIIPDLDYLKPYSL